MHISSVKFSQISGGTALCLLFTDTGAVTLHCHSTLPISADQEQHRSEWFKDALRQQRQMPEIRNGESEIYVCQYLLFDLGVTEMRLGRTPATPKNDGNRPHFSITILCKQLQVAEMQNQTVELNSVIYNAANQSFEALAKVYAETTPSSFACAINAPIDMNFKDAARGLTTQALRRFNGNAGLSSAHPLSMPSPMVRAGSMQPRKVVDAFEMLRQLAA